MSKYSEIEDNSVEKDYIENLCQERFEKYSNPCKSCRFRHPIKGITRTCLWGTCPRDWKGMES